MKRAGLYLQLAVLALWCLGPFLWALDTSLKPDAQLTRLPPLLPEPPVAGHYLAIFRDYPLWHIIFNSAIVAVATTLLALAVGTLAAFALARLPLKGKGLLLAGVLSVSMFPPIATVSPLYLVIQKLGLRDTLAALILTYTTFSLPLAIWVLTHFIRDLPGELYLAARVDGCTAFQAFRRVLLPLCAPGLVATGLLVFIFSWNEFLYALTFTATVSSRTVPVAIAMFPGLHEVPWGEIAAASIVVTLPIVVLAFAFQRRIVEGLTAGSVKG
jgi:multiple sugar transport system permease protein